MSIGFSVTGNTPYGFNLGAVTLNGNTTFNTANNGTGTGTLTINGVVSQTGGARSVTKTGAGTLVMANSNTYTGNTILSPGSGIAGGTLVAAATNALGTGAMTATFNTGALSAQLQLTGGITLPNAINTTGAGTGNTGIIRNISGNNTLTGVISLIGGGGNSTYQSDAGTLTTTNFIGANAGVAR